MTYLAGFAIGATYGFVCGFLFSLAVYTYRFAGTRHRRRAEPRKDAEPCCPSGWSNIRFENVRFEDVRLDWTEEWLQRMGRG